ncbi:PH domain-containing protein [Corynebacterium sp. HMSC074E01]|uniref:PH domain-containing protein n=1 Tax=Corynebacterium TaxID=1716 RepID=UPI0008A64D18|nr:PH domain-containing protein [Corynebacterium sp. HMSC074E01]MDK6807214.1 PH domain-containing protein [Corynebacterium aurimucosum]NJJ83084.1 PH domain-containing protein [Corynebacterium aurimucosum]OFN76222.1 hypothetical protein HMPREF2537_10300 [Corynebacterium sp. HMSC074E01]
MTSSHPQNASTRAEHPTAETFKPTREHLLGIGILAAIAFLSIGWAPKYLFWVLIFPVLAIWWVLRARTTVDGKGVHISYGFRGPKNIEWGNFKGIGFQRSRAYARTTSGNNFNLPGVTFNSLPRLAAASNGRIPDALTAGRNAADDKVIIVHRDGQQVLLTKEEYAEYLKKHPELKD